MDSDRVPIPGSELKPRAGERLVAPVASSEQVALTILLRKPGSAPSQEQLLSGRYERKSREEAERALTADAADIAAVQKFADDFGLSIVEENPEARRIRVAGNAQHMADAFGVRLSYAEDAEGQRHLTYSGSLSVPKSLSGVVVAVLGFDRRPVARAHPAP